MERNLHRKDGGGPLAILQSYYQDVYKCPVTRLPRYSGHYGLESAILAYLDFGGATGTCKDGVAEAMLAFATERGDLKPGMPVVEASSGSFGAALAVACATTGHDCILVVPSSLPAERKKHLQNLGARIVACNAHGRKALEHIAADTAAREGAGYDLVVAAGGDGTLNEVISGLMRLDAPPPLGYLPQGTTNDFASSLQIPRDPAAAAENIVQNRERALDIGRWNERSFIYVASFGAFTRSSYAASQAAKNALGHFAYILEGMKDLNTLRPYHIRLTADGEVLDGDYLFGAVCNSTSIGGLMKLDPERVVLDDGKFEMLLVPSPKTAADLQNLVLALLNQQYDSQGLVFRHVSSLRLETEEELPWSLDGEYAPSVPVVDIVNRQRALRMLL